MKKTTVTLDLFVGRRRARRGFTLIELLVVMAILAILGAMTMAGVQRIRKSQDARNTEGHLIKIQHAVRAQVKAINEQVAQDANAQTADFRTLLNYCEGDSDRAKALLTYARIKQAFPQTAAEIASPAGFSVGGVNFPRPPAFARLQGISGDPNHVAAALLYVAINDRSPQGYTFPGGEVIAPSEIPLGGRSFSVYLDAWRNPITLRRFHLSPELDTADYAPSNGVKNPFDPGLKLYSWNPAVAQRKTDAQTALNTGLEPFTFSNRHQALVVFSAGTNGQYELENGDDILGYRLESVGRRGGVQP